MTDTPDQWGLRPGNNKQPFKVVAPSEIGETAVRRALEPAPEPHPEQQKVGDLVQLAGWLNVISFLDLLALAKSITDSSDADAAMPADVKLAKALATCARKILSVTERAA